MRTKIFIGTNRYCERIHFLKTVKTNLKNKKERYEVNEINIIVTLEFIKISKKIWKNLKFQKEICLDHHL